MYAPLEDLLVRQHDCVSAWQLRGEGWSRKHIDKRLPRCGLRPVEGISGVWTSSRDELTRLQRWSAATLTAPGTALSFISAALHQGWGDRPGRELYIVVTRRGRGPARRHGDILVCRNTTSIIEEKDGIAMVSPACTLIDLAPYLDDKRLRRAVIEAIRLRCVSLDELLELLPRRRGAPRLRAICHSAADLPIARCKSNAEATALVRRKAVGRPPVKVNIRIAGHEADLVDLERRHITELDGPAFHADVEKDAAATRSWRRRGFTVGRRPSEDAYDDLAQW